MLYFYCVGINEKGGETILNQFRELSDVFYFLDKRLERHFSYNKNIIFLKSNFISRTLDLFNINKKIKSGDHIIFLNGLPPFMNFKCKVSVIFQNANIFKYFYNKNFFYWFFSKDFLRYIAFEFGKKNVNDWIVLSPIAKSMLKKYLNNYNNIKIVNIFEKYKKNNHSIKNHLIKYDFIYPASLMAHKNHKLLIDSFILLSKQNIFPSLLLTLNNSELKKIKFDYLKKKYNLKIFNYHEKDVSKFQNIYKECNALIYVSENETLGLPIIEAWANNLIILSIDKEYSSQFIDPNFQFKNKKESLVNAIKKYNSKKNFLTNNSKLKNFSSFSFNEYINYIK